VVQCEFRVALRKNLIEMVLVASSKNLIEVGVLDISSKDS